MTNVRPIFIRMVILHACVTPRAGQLDGEGVNSSPVSESLKKSQESFAERNPPIVSAVGDLHWTVRMVTPAEIPEDDYRVWVYPIAQSANTVRMLKRQ